MRAVVWVMSDGKLELAAEVLEDGQVNGPFAESLSRWIQSSGLEGEKMLRVLAKRWTNGYMAVELRGGKVEKTSTATAIRTYITSGEDAPEGVSVKRGPRGGRYYEGKAPEPKERFEFSPNEPPDTKAKPYSPTLGELINNPSWDDLPWRKVSSYKELFDQYHLNMRAKAGTAAAIAMDIWKDIPLEHFIGVHEVHNERATPERLASYDRNKMSIALAFDGSPCAKNVKRQGAVHEVGHAVFDGLWRPPGLDKKSVDAAATELRKRVLASYAGAIREAGADVMLTVLTGIMLVGTPEEFFKRVQKARAVTPYALSDVNEWFAENYSWYVLHSKGLKKTNPEMYDIMVTVFGGKEYKR